MKQEMCESSKKISRRRFSVNVWMKFYTPEVFNGDQVCSRPWLGRIVPTLQAVVGHGHHRHGKAGPRRQIVLPEGLLGARRTGARWGGGKGGGVSSIDLFHCEVWFYVADNGFSMFLWFFGLLDVAPRLLQRSIRRIVLVGAWVNHFATFRNFGLEHLS